MDKSRKRPQIGRFSFSVLVIVSFFVCMQLTFMWVMLRARSDNTSVQQTQPNQPLSFRIIKQATTAFATFGYEKTESTKEQEATSETQRPTTALFTTLGSSVTMSTTKKKVVDMENDYYPLVRFSFVWPETEPVLTEKRDFFLVVLVNSAARGDKYRARRNAIRQTWANSKGCERTKSLRNPKSSQHRWFLVFSLGKSGAETPTLDDKANAVEAKLNNDILIGDFQDHYLNNVIKVFMGELWVSTMNVRYILKTDDDVYVRLPLLVDWLVTQNYPKLFYGGAPYSHFIVDRDPKGKWAVSKKYFNEEYFPTFCAGAFYVLSTDILSRMLNYVRQRRPFHTDDAYVGIAARDLNITVNRIPGFLLEDNMPMYLSGFGDCRLLRARAYGHSLEPPLMNTIHNRLEDLCRKNITC